VQIFSFIVIVVWVVNPPPLPWTVQTNVPDILPGYTVRVVTFDPPAGTIIEAGPETRVYPLGLGGM
jgi:hypothetical protein